MRPSRPRRASSRRRCPSSFRCSARRSRWGGSSRRCHWPRIRFYPSRPPESSLSPSSGYTSAVRPTAAALLFLFALLLAILPLQPGIVAGAFGAVPPPPSSNPLSSVALSLGFGPSSLSPVSNGIPVYTVGDTIWAESAYNFSIPLSVTSETPNPCLVCLGLPAAPPPAMVKAAKVLEKGVIPPVYTFLSTDPHVA